MLRDALLQWIDDILEDVKYFERVRKFVCPDCTSAYGSIEKKKDKPKPFLSCPACGGHLEDCVLGVPDVSIKGNITTVGQLADANTKKLGRYEKEERDRKQAEANKMGRSQLKLPDKSKMDRISKINKMTPAQKEKYIYTGEGL